MPAFKTRILDAFRQVFHQPSLEQWLLQRTLNQPIYSFWGKLTPNPYSYTAGSFRTFRREGVEMQVDLADLNGWYLYFGFQDPPKQVLFNLAQPGHVVVDVGANIGETGLRLAQRVGESGRVLAFEPHPHNAEVARGNYARNALPWLELHQVGLGSQPGQFSMYVPDVHNSGMNRIVPKGQVVEGQQVTVAITTLDTIVDAEGLQRLDLIKIDTEGFEFEVLKGAENCLRKFQPVLFFELDECNLKAQGTSPQELLTWLEALGYTFNLAEWKTPITAKSPLQGVHADVVARIACEARQN